MEQRWERGLPALGEGKMPSLQACSLRVSAAGTGVRTFMEPKRGRPSLGEGRMPSFHFFLHPSATSPAVNTSKAIRENGY